MVNVELGILVSIMGILFAAAGSYVAFRIAGARFQAQTEQRLMAIEEWTRSLDAEMTETRGFIKALDPGLGDRVGMMQQEVAGLTVIAKSIGPLQKEIQELSHMMHQMYGAYMREHPGQLFGKE